jgi:hypothetical protein
VKSATISTAIDQANGMFIATDGRTHRYLIHVKNTNGAGQNAIIRAAATTLPYEAFRQGLGDLTVSLAATTGEKMIVVDSARFVQPGGNLNVDFDAGTAGSVAVYKLPVQI